MLADKIWNQMLSGPGINVNKITRIYALLVYLKFQILKHLSCKLFPNFLIQSEQFSNINILWNRVMLLLSSNKNPGTHSYGNSFFNSTCRLFLLALWFHSLSIEIGFKTLNTLYPLFKVFTRSNTVALMTFFMSVLKI